MLVSLGQCPDSEELKRTLSLLPQPVTFSSYLTGMSNNLCQLSSREELIAAFEAFGDDDSESASENGIPTEDIRQMLVSHGMSDKDVNNALGGFIKNGLLGERFDYKALVSVLRE